MSEQVSYQDPSGEEEEGLLLDPDVFPTDRYKPIRELGRGASGVVFECMDRVLQRKVAVKTLLMLTDEQLVSFHKEAKATSKLSHRNIVQVLDFGLTEGSTPFMALDFIEGIALDNYIEKYGPLKASTAVEVFIQVCDALTYAHSNEIFHRDLKPENIIISESETGASARLIDFGLADFKKDSQPTEFQGRTLVGTPAYMSPDQLAGKVYDARSEVYAFGCVMFEALSGQVPFQGDTPLETLAMHARQTPPNLKEIAGTDAQIPDRLLAVVARCMAKEPENRYQSIDELRQALVASTLEITREEPVFIPTPSKQQLQRRNILFFVSFFAGAICVIAIAAYTVSKLLDDKSLQTDLAALDENEDLTTALVKKSSRPHVIEVEGGGHTVVGGTTGHSLKVLDGRHDIKDLSLEFTQLTGNKCRYFTGLNLHRLVLSTCEIDKETMHYIAGLNHLEILHIRNSSGLKEINFGILDRLKRLKDFSISRSTCPDDILFQISHLTTLETLGLRFIPNLEQTDFPLLANLKNLRNLDLTGIPLDFDAYRDLAAIHSIETLWISHLPDESAQALASMKLDSLTIYDSPRLSKAGLLAIGNIKTLKHLTLYGCSRISQPVIRKLKEKLPLCKVQVMVEGNKAEVY